MNWKYPLSDIDLNDQENEAVNEVLTSKWLTMGEVTKRFEDEFAKFTEVKHAIAVTNCTAALHLAFKGLGIGYGDEVIVPSFSFVATANAILYVDAKPIFADITSLDNWNISPKDIEKKISSRTKAIILMHYGGYPCDMNSINSIAEKHNLFIIEDAAHAPGAEYNGEKCGSLSDVACFSFFSNKNMTTGEGGMITTDDDSLAKKMRVMRSHGMTTMTLDRHKGHSFSYDVTELGYNYRLDEIRAALGLVQLGKLQENNQKREVLTKQYRKKLAEINWLGFPFNGQSDEPAYHIFSTLLSPEVRRKDFIEYLRSKGIQTSIHYPPIHLFSFYKNSIVLETSLPITEEVARRELTLPLSPLMIEEDIEYIVNAIKDYAFYN
ncbi:MAG: DegT/DnrJ/EryC1/StrS family aminotransferase [Bacteroidetes bacterium]|nr:DegT/DnrJ/EryC1/StrS family aminotransferase [Bacteroidota bacterium]